MDIDQEDMQFLGLIGIYKEACKVIFSCKKIFSQIALTLILPLSFMFLAHAEVTDALFDKIVHYEHDLEKSAYNKIFHRVLSSEWMMLLLSKAIFFTFLLIFSLLSTAAVLYTIVCVYTARGGISFKKVVMSVVPKVWKRLLATFLCIFVAMLVYSSIFFIAQVLWSKLIGDTDIIGMSIFVIIWISYGIGVIYMGTIWNLASAVSVLEDVYGVQAMVKSKDLIKGKMDEAMLIFCFLNLSLVVIQFVFQELVVNGGEYTLGRMSRLVYGILCLLLHFMVILFALVVQTVLYFVCKSYHHENIDKSALSDHLEVYLLAAECVLLKKAAMEIQLEHFDV